MQWFTFVNVPRGTAGGVFGVPRGTKEGRQAGPDKRAPPKGRV